VQEVLLIAHGMIVLKGELISPNPR
jgi:hypothetical protein